MVSKILNFPDAMKLAQIITKYFDTESIKEMTGEEFGYKLFDVLDQDEILQVASLLLGDEATSMKPREIIVGSVEGLVKNNLFDLIQAYQEVGIK